jgi:RimJ/RimL family protein N-acetyltransferase
MDAGRVTLRQWRDSDLGAYAAMNRDLEVMRFFPALLSEEESRVSMERQRKLISERGWGLWAVDVGGAFAGFTGLAVPRFEAPFMPAVEIGWRLRTEFWGRGIAQAAARCAVGHAFGPLGLTELVSFTAAVNTRSRRLMERLGFHRDPQEDFLHPLLVPESPLCLHVLYRRRCEDQDAGAPRVGSPTAVLA